MIVVLYSWEKLMLTNLKGFYNIQTQDFSIILLPAVKLTDSTENKFILYDFEQMNCRHVFKT